MDEGAVHDGAINLSTAREGQELANGDLARSNGDAAADSLQGPALSLGTAVATSSSITTKPATGAVTGAAKRKGKTISEVVQQQQQQAQQQQQQAGGSSPPQSSVGTVASPQQPLVMMAGGVGAALGPFLQHLPLSPQHVPSAVQQQQQQQQQQTFIMQAQQQKMNEQLQLQLNEQLQMNVLKQSQLVQQQDKSTKSSSKQSQQQLQQLGLQQQQLVQQLQQLQQVHLQQQQQRQLALAFLAQPYAQQGVMSPADFQQLWKDVLQGSGSEDGALKAAGLNGLPLPPSSTQPPFLANGSMLPLDGFLGSFNHSPGYKMDKVGLDGGTAAGEEANSSPLYRHGVCRWPGCDVKFNDHHAFLKHLNSAHQLDDRSTAQCRVQLQVVSQLEIQLAKERELLQAMMQHLHMKPQPAPLQPPPVPPQPHSAPHTPRQVSPPSPAIPESSQDLTSPLMGKHMKLPTTTPLTPVSLVTAPMVSIPSLPTTPTSQPPSLIQALPIPQQTPPSTGPMRRRVSDKCNLPISTEIQRNREFYKTTDVRPPFTYASLIRQAIIESPHRQLTLNEIYQWFQNTFAYFRRNEATWKNAVRHNLSLHKCFMRVENVKGAVWTVDEIEFYKRRPQKMSGGNIKSPSLSDPNSYNETLNASLRAALGETSMLLGSPHLSSSVSQESAEDLSIRSQPNGQDSLPALALARDDLLLNIKQEPCNGPESSGYLDQETSSQGLYDGQDSQQSLPVGDPTQDAESSLTLGEQSQGEGLGEERMDMEPEDEPPSTAALAPPDTAMASACADAMDEREATGDGFPGMKSEVSSPSSLPHSTAIGCE